MLLNSLFDAGDIVDGVPAKLVDDLPVGLLDTDGLVLDRYAEIPIYPLSFSDEINDGEMLQDISNVQIPLRKVNTFPITDNDPITVPNDCAVSPNRQAVAVRSIGLRSRSYAPLVSFRYVGEEAIISLGGIDDAGNTVMLTDIDQAYSDSNNNITVINRRLIVLLRIKRDVPIEINVERQGRVNNRTNIIFI